MRFDGGKSVRVMARPVTLLYLVARVEEQNKNHAKIFGADSHQKSKGGDDGRPCLLAICRGSSVEIREGWAGV